MKDQYIEEIPVQTIEHKVIVCNNCEELIKDNNEYWNNAEHYQTGDKEGRKLLDFCSEKCMNKFVKRDS